MYFTVIMLEEFMKIYSTLVCSVTNITLLYIYIDTYTYTYKNRQQWQNAHKTLMKMTNGKNQRVITTGLW